MEPLSPRADGYEESVPAVDMKQRALPIVRALFEKEIFVRDGSSWDMPSFMRVSVGTAEDNEVFLKALKKIV